MPRVFEHLPGFLQLIHSLSNFLCFFVRKDLKRTLVYLIARQVVLAWLLNVFLHDLAW